MPKKKSEEHNPTLKQLHDRMFHAWQFKEDPVDGIRAAKAVWDEYVTKGPTSVRDELFKQQFARALSPRRKSRSKKGK